MSSAKAALVARIAALQRAREEEGDVVIRTEGGATTRAHSLVLSMGSEYFKAALSSTWEREGRAEQTLQAAPAAVAIAIDFMYGIEVPAGLGLEAPGGLAEVLRLADMLLAEELKEEVARLLANHLAVDNYRAICGLAERHQASALAAACARFVAEEVEAPDWAAIQQAPSVATAMARIAFEKDKEKKFFKKREDYGSVPAYEDYVRSVVREGTKVRVHRVCGHHGYAHKTGLCPHSGLPASFVGTVLGDITRNSLRVAWKARELAVFLGNVEPLPADS